MADDAAAERVVEPLSDAYYDFGFLFDGYGARFNAASVLRRLDHHGHRTIGGIELRMVSILPPIFRPNMVPRS